MKKRAAKNLSFPSPNIGQKINEALKVLSGRNLTTVAVELALKDLAQNYDITIDALRKDYKALQDSEKISIGPSGKNDSTATELLGLVERIGEIDVFLIPAGESFVTFPKQQEETIMMETTPINSEAFRTYLRRKYREHYVELCSSEAINTVISYLAGEATEIKPIFVRIAHHHGKIYIDVANQLRQCIEISPNKNGAGCRVLKASECPVKFWRPKGMLPLPLPQEGGTLENLRQFLNIQTADQWHRVLMFLLSTFSNGPQLLLEIVGEKGSAKSTQASIIRSLYDPNEADRQSPPETERDLFLSCRHQALLFIDNVSKISAVRSDAHSTIATGGSWRERQLYSNGEEFIYKFRIPQIVTAIKDVIIKSDLADRKLKLELQPISKGQRQTEKKIFKELEPVIPKILGALYSAVSGALAELPNILATELPRMADAAEYLLAIEKYLNWPERTVLAMFEDEAQADAEEALEGDSFATALIDELKSRENYWQATAKEILQVLANKQPDGKLPISWPRTGKAFANRLRELGSDFRRNGLTYTKESGGEKRYTLKLQDKVTNPPEVTNKPEDEVLGAVTSNDTFMQAEKVQCDITPDVSLSRMGNLQSDDNLPDAKSRADERLVTYGNLGISISTLAGSGYHQEKNAMIFDE